jgi:hypothetical protein
MSQDIIHIISSSDLSYLKKQAKLLARQKGVQHAKALDQVAQRLDLPNWKAVMQQHKNCLPTEEVLKSGYVISVDIKDSRYMNVTDHFIQDPMIPILKRKEMLKRFKQSPEITGDDETETGRTLEEAYSEAELMEYFISYVDDHAYYRLKPEYQPTGNKELVDWSVEDFYPGIAIFGWVKGEYQEFLFD